MKTRNFLVIGRFGADRSEQPPGIGAENRVIKATPPPQMFQSDDGVLREAFRQAILDDLSGERQINDQTAHLYPVE